MMKHGQPEHNLNTNLNMADSSQAEKQLTTRLMRLSCAYETIIMQIHRWDGPNYIDQNGDSENDVQEESCWMEALGCEEPGV